MARDLLLQHEKTIQALAITNLQMKGSMLKDQLDLIQDTIKLDNRRWEIYDKQEGDVGLFIVPRDPHGATVI